MSGAWIRRCFLIIFESSCMDGGVFRLGGICWCKRYSKVQCGSHIADLIPASTFARTAPRRGA